MERTYEIGAHVIFVDAFGKRHEALVTTWWGNFGGGPEKGCNLLIVSKDESKDDSYGRQIERHTSVCHKKVQPAHGMYWCWPDEVSNVPAFAQTPHNDA